MPLRSNAGFIYFAERTPHARAGGLAGGGLGEGLANHKWMSGLHAQVCKFPQAGPHPVPQYETFNLGLEPGGMIDVVAKPHLPLLLLHADLEHHVMVDCTRLSGEHRTERRFFSSHALFAFSLYEHCLTFYFISNPRHFTRIAKHIYVVAEKSSAVSHLPFLRD